MVMVLAGMLVIAGDGHGFGGRGGSSCRRLLLIGLVVLLRALLGRREEVVDVGLGEELAAAEGGEALLHLELEGTRPLLLRTTEKLHLSLHSGAQLLLGRSEESGRRGR